MEFRSIQMLGMRHRHPCENGRVWHWLSCTAVGRRHFRTARSGKKDFIVSGLLKFHVPQTPGICLPLLKVLAISTFYLYWNLQNVHVNNVNTKLYLLSKFQLEVNLILSNNMNGISNLIFWLYVSDIDLIDLYSCICT